METGAWPSPWATPSRTTTSVTDSSFGAVQVGTQILYRMRSTASTNWVSQDTATLTATVTSILIFVHVSTFAAYTSTTSGSASVTTGVVAIALAVDGTGNRLDVPATDVLPGDTIARVVDLSSTSTDPLSWVKLTTTAPRVTSALNTDGTNGLQLLVQRCADPWGSEGS